MNYSTYNISLDIHDTASQVSLNVKKGDTARRICAVFTENGKPYKIADGCTAVFRAKKPARDNGERAIVYNDTQIIDNKICYVVTSANTETAGVADCEFTLYGADGKAITSPKFTLVIDNTVNSDGEVENIGTNELTALTIAFANATAATNSAKEAANSAKEATNSAKEAANSAKEAANDATGVANKIKQTAESGGFDGKDGAIYTPYVDNNGNLSWSNNGNLENPLTKNITGPRGVSGVYVGSGKMPEGYNVQIDPDGDASMRLEIGTVETLEEGQDATASISGTADAPILNLGIPKGADGRDGKDGATPTIGENDNWFVNGKDTGISAKGPKGDVVLPYIQNGVWYVNGENTGISAQGPQGVPGPVSEIAIGSVSTAEDGKARAYLTKTEDGVKLHLALPRGEDGATPTIGDNGNWWINGKDTGNTARCEAAVGEWEEIYNTTLTEAVTSYTKTIPADKKYTEVFVQGELYIDTDATASASIDIIIGRKSTVITRNTISVKNVTKLYYRAHGWLSPYKTIIYDAAVSTATAAGNLTRNAGDASTKTFEYFPEVLIQTSNSTTYKLGAGSTIKIWGR